MYDDLEQKPKTAKQGLVDALGGASIAPGEGAPNASPAPTLDQPVPSLPAAPAAPKANTRLMEGTTEKLADLGHAVKSPKYDFLQLAQQNKYGYNQLPEMLKELQGGANAKHWQGWTADKDKLRYSGDPNALGSEWGGVNTVDTVGGFGADGSNASGWRWGVADGDPSAPQGNGGPSFAGSTISPMLQGNAQAGIQSALQGMGGDSSRLQELIKALGGMQ
jgi:hypothetical protein